MTEQRITYQEVPGDILQIQVTCYLIHESDAEVTSFKMEKTLLHQDWMWQEIRTRFAMLDMQYAVRMEFLNPSL